MKLFPCYLSNKRINPWSKLGHIFKYPDLNTEKSNFLRFDNILIHVYIRNFTWNWISKKINSYICFYVNLSFKAAVENVIKEEIAMKFMSFTLFYISKERQEKIIIENTCKNEIIGKFYYISYISTMMSKMLANFLHCDKK